MPEVANLKGRLAFTYAVGPAFVMSLLARYGYSSIKELEGPLSTI